MARQHLSPNGGHRLVERDEAIPDLLSDIRKNRIGGPYHKLDYDIVPISARGKAPLDAVRLRKTPGLATSPAGTDEANQVFEPQRPDPPPVPGRTLVDLARDPGDPARLRDALAVAFGRPGARLSHAAPLPSRCLRVLLEGRGLLQRLVLMAWRPLASSAPSETRRTALGRCPVPLNICSRVKTSLTGLPTSRAAMAARKTCDQVLSASLEVVWSVAEAVERPAYYPDPPQDFVLSPDVEAMWQRYEQYLLGHEPLLSMAYACLSRLRFSSRNAPAKMAREKVEHVYGIEEAVLRKLGELTPNLGDEAGARKMHVGSVDRPPTDQEREWIEAAVRALARRAGEHSADPTRTWPRVGMTGLPNL